MTSYALLKHAALRRIRILAEPGEYLRFCLEDVREVAARARQQERTADPLV
jgi:hypothetical protein